MSLFDSQFFIQQLSELRQYKESTVALSNYIIINDSSYLRIVEILKEFYCNINNYHRLTIFYMCHEILNSIRQH